MNVTAWIICTGGFRGDEKNATATLVSLFASVRSPETVSTATGFHFAH